MSKDKYQKSMDPVLNYEYQTKISALSLSFLNEGLHYFDGLFIEGPHLFEDDTS
jgi:hypothetical protein